MLGHDGKGYIVKRVKLVDMYPHIRHVEVVAQMYFNGKR